MKIRHWMRRPLIMTKDYFFRVRLELDEKDPEDRISLDFDFPDGETAARFAEMAYKSCDIINVYIKILYDEVDTTNSPMWRKPRLDFKQMLNNRYGYAATDSFREAKDGNN